MFILLTIMFKKYLKSITIIVYFFFFLIIQKQLHICHRMLYEAISYIVDFTLWLYIIYNYTYYNNF